MGGNRVWSANREYVVCRDYSRCGEEYHLGRRRFGSVHPSSQLSEDETLKPISFNFAFEDEEGDEQGILNTIVQEEEQSGFSDNGLASTVVDLRPIGVKFGYNSSPTKEGTNWYNRKQLSISDYKLGEQDIFSSLLFDKKIAHKEKKLVYNFCRQAKKSILPNQRAIQGLLWNEHESDSLPSSSPTSLAP
ncbi:hypothetical protein YC2023_064648 [Brassica napus]